MKIKDNYELFIILLLDLNTQIGLTDTNKFNELSKCFEISQEEFISENNKQHKLCYQLNMDMFSEKDRIRNYTEEQFQELIRLSLINNELEKLSGILKGLVIYKQDQETLNYLIQKYRYESVKLVKEKYPEDCHTQAWS